MPDAWPRIVINWETHEVISCVGVDPDLFTSIPDTYHVQTTCGLSAIIRDQSTLIQTPEQVTCRLCAVCSK